MATIYKYRVFCPTENMFQEIWAETEPTKCSNGDDLDSNQTTIIDEISSEQVTIKEEETPTGGHYRVMNVTLTAPPAQTTTVFHSFPFPIGVISAKIMTRDAHEGDSLNVLVAPNTTIGVAMAPVMPGDRLIHVSPTVVAYIQIGFRATLADATNVDVLGDVLAIDKVNNTITTQDAAVHVFSPLSPTFVKMTIVFADNLIFGSGGLYSFGESKIGSSHVPADTICQFDYRNVSTTETKSIYPIIEFLY